MEPEQEAQIIQPPEGPSPWIPLGPAHLLIWIALLWPLVANSILWPLAYRAGGAGEMLGWVVSLPTWAIGGGAIALGLKAQETEVPGTLRRAAFIAAMALWVILAGIGLMSRLHVFGNGEGAMIYWRMEPWAALLLASVPLGLMLVSKEEQSGGSFDAAITTLAIMGGLGFAGPLFLAFGVLVGSHPMPVVAWESVRRPVDAIKGEWFDGSDESRRSGNLGQMALVFILMVPLILALILVERSFNRFGFSPSAPWARALEAYLTAPLLAFAALRFAKRSGQRKGRALAIATLVASGLLLLPVLIGVVLLILWAGHVIR